MHDQELDLTLVYGERSSALRVDGECVMALRSGDRMFECGVLVCEYTL